MRRTLASSPQSECSGCRQQEHASSKNLHQQNLPVLNWKCHLTQVDLYNGHKMVFFVLLLFQFSIRLCLFSLHSTSMGRQYNLFCAESAVKSLTSYQPIM